MNQIKVIHENNFSKEILTNELREILFKLHSEFEPKRKKLLKSREEQQRKFDSGEVPKFSPDHEAKKTNWKVASIPEDFLDRRVEITGPISSTKMVIQMLSENAEGEIACTAMLDFEDSMKPSWENVESGIKNIIGVSLGSLSYSQKSVDGKEKIYRLNTDKMARPMVRVRGLHLNESNVLIGREPIAAGLFDLTVTAFHTAQKFLKNGITPHFYIPKTEHYLESRWWNELLGAIESNFGLSKGTLRTTLLIETLPAAFQMEEILFEQRERILGLNGGRWDKIFSDIKTLKSHQDRVMANRSSIDMTRPWMDSYAKLLIKTCHKHGAFGMGGMSAFTPGKDEKTREVQIAKVIADKKRESDIGHDGCWVSHPYFIGFAKKQFQKKNQLDVSLSDFSAEPDLLPQSTGPKTLEGLRQNIRVGIAYQQGWNQGLGCISFENLMEDLATLEISRAQVWQWLHHKIKLDDGTSVTKSLVEKIFDEECERIFVQENVHSSEEKKSYQVAKEEAQKVFLMDELPPFFTNI